MVEILPMTVTWRKAQFDLCDTTLASLAKPLILHTQRLEGIKGRL